MLAADIEWLLERSQHEPGIWLVTLTDGVIDGTERFAIHPKPVISRGQTFKPAWFEFEEPSDTEEMPASQVLIPNVNRMVGKALEQGRAGFIAHFELVRDDDRDRVVDAYRNLVLRTSEVDHLMVKAVLSASDFANEVYFPVKVTPRAFLGLYK